MLLFFLYTFIYPIKKEEKKNAQKNKGKNMRKTGCQKPEWSNNEGWKKHTKKADTQKGDEKNKNFFGKSVRSFQASFP